MIDEVPKNILNYSLSLNYNKKFSSKSFLNKKLGLRNCRFVSIDVDLKPALTTRDRKRNAFSLIEVALALGIVSFGLLVVVGMLPIGLKSLSESMDDSVKTQINQQITGKLLIIPYRDVDSFVAQGPFFFTEEGILQTSKDSTTFYQVDLLRVDSDYPGVSGLSVPEKERLRDNSLTTIKVAISKIGGYGSVGTSVTAAPFSPASLAATPAPSYQVIQVANSFGTQP